MRAACACRLGATAAALRHRQGGERLVGGRGKRRASSPYSTARPRRMGAVRKRRRTWRAHAVRER